MDATLDAIPASKRSVACQTCATSSARYTCPRCGFKTCSLNCSKAHKAGTTTDAGCSGIKENNAGGFVAMNTYGYSTFVNDYVFLEEVGRKVGGWGRDIREKKLLGHAQGSAGNSNARGRRPRIMGGGHRGDNRGGKGRSKREVLRDMLLERADIDLQLCPEGMERRKMNQSSWDAKANTGYLTIQYRFHRAGTLAPSNHDRQRGPGTKHKTTLDAETGEVVPLLTHRNGIETTIKDSLRHAMGERSKKGAGHAAWIREMILSDEDYVTPSVEEQESAEKSGNEYVVLLRGSMVPLDKGVRVAYERLDIAVALVEALRGHSFVEFPTLEVIREREWTQVGHGWEMNAEKDARNDESEGEGESHERRAKRRKIDEEDGKRLLGELKAYGGEEDEESDINHSDSCAASERKPSGLLELLDYSSDSSEASELEDTEEAAALTEKTALDLGLLGETEEADWDNE